MGRSAPRTSMWRNLALRKFQPGKACNRNSAHRSGDQLNKQDGKISIHVFIRSPSCSGCCATQICRNRVFRPTQSGPVRFLPVEMRSRLVRAIQAVLVNATDCIAVNRLYRAKFPRSHTKLQVFLLENSAAGEFTGCQRPQALKRYSSTRLGEPRIQSSDYGARNVIVQSSAVRSAVLRGALDARVVRR